MSNYTAETPARCPKCGGALTERIGRSMREVVYMYDCDHCDWDDEYARADRLTVATAPWSRDLWAEVQRLTAERDALRAAAADREHPLHFAVRMADAYYRENGRGAAELDAANLAWTQAGCPLEVEITAEDMVRLSAERDAALAEVERLRALAQPRVPSCPPSSGSDATLLVWIEGYDGVWCLAPANDRSISSAVYDATCDEARKWDGDDCIRSFDTGSVRLAVRVIAAWAREDGYHVPLHPLGWDIGDEATND